MGEMNTTKSSTYIYTGIVSLLGVLVSFFLIREFYGTAGDFVNSLCSVTGGDNGCATVAASSYSGFRGIPFLGDIPVALFGFTYYGLLAFLSYSGFKNPQESINSLRSVFLLSILGLVVDLALFAVSIFLVRAICPLCIFTYVLTLFLGIISFMELKKIEDGKSLWKIPELPFLKKESFNFLLIILFFITCGLAGGRAGSGGTQMAATGDQSLIQKKIDAYESAPKLNLDLNDIPFSGDPKAPITIVKFADFNCGHCMHTSHLLRQILQEYSGLVKVYYKNFPLDGNCNPIMSRKSPDSSSCIAAGASICAHKQSKFKPTYEDIYTDTEKGIRHSALSVLEIAKRNNLNIPNFTSCMGSKEVSDSIVRDVREAERINITSTPSLFINDRAIEPGTPDPIFLRALLNHISKKI